MPGRFGGGHHAPHGHHAHHAHHAHHGHQAPAPAGPRVLFASYGGLDVTQKVQQMSNTHRHVHVGPGEYTKHFGDPAPGELKDFVLVVVEGPKCFCHIAADNQPTNITAGFQTSSPRTAPAHGSEILSANYGGVDVTAQCRDVFNHKGGLHFERSMNEMFGDTLHLVEKLLTVVFKTTQGTTPHRACTYWSEAERPNLTRDGPPARGPPHQAPPAQHSRGLPGHHQPHHPPHHQPHHPPAHNARGMPQAAAGPRILFASYGGSDVTHHVQKMYNSHHGKLSIAPGQYVANFTDPFPKQMKDFVVMAVDNNCHSHVHIASDTQPTHVDGSAPQHSTPHHGPPPHASEIIQANYGGADVTHKCKQMFDHRHGLRFERTVNETFGDTLPGVHKRLAVIYMTSSGTTPHRACVHYGEADRPHIPHKHH